MNQIFSISKSVIGVVDYLTVAPTFMMILTVAVGLAST